jgi:hypothetical protein
MIPTILGATIVVFAVVHEQGVSFMYRDIESTLLE